jgi:hypothetical protein
MAREGDNGKRTINTSERKNSSHALLFGCNYVTEKIKLSGQSPRTFLRGRDWSFEHRSRLNIQAVQLRAQQKRSLSRLLRRNTFVLLLSYTTRLPFARTRHWLPCVTPKRGPLRVQN